jgi:hypothetical protein
MGGTGMGYAYVAETHVSGARHGAPDFVGVQMRVNRPLEFAGFRCGPPARKPTTPPQTVKLSEMGHPVFWGG